MILDFFNIVWS